MARPKKSTTKVKVERATPKKEATVAENLLGKLQVDLKKNQSYLNYVLGGLVVIIIGVLLFNYFNKPKDLGPSQQTEQKQEQQSGDVAKDKLPGKYTIKEGDTLFKIAESYYNDGYKYTSIVEENKLSSADVIEVGQEITIPKLAGEQVAQSSPEPSASPSATPQVEQAQSQPETTEVGQGGAENATIWGDKITGDTYTVTAGDWLSTIAGRAYGDIAQYEKIAKANNIQNPDVIEVGTVLKLPR